MRIRVLYVDVLYRGKYLDESEEEETTAAAEAAAKQINHQIKSKNLIWTKFRLKIINFLDLF